MCVCVQDSQGKSGKNAVDRECKERSYILDIQILCSYVIERGVSNNTQREGLEMPLDNKKIERLANDSM